MKKASIGIKLVNIAAVTSGFTGMLMSVKIPGTVSLLPLVIGFGMGLLTLFLTKKKEIRCVGCYLAVSLASIGILISILIQLTTEPEVAVDKKFDQEQVESANEVEKSEDIDDALDELDDLE